MSKPAAAALAAAFLCSGAMGEAPPNLVADYCVACHNAKGKAGGLSLEGFNAAAPGKNLEAAEKTIQKLRSGRMPPPGMKRPNAVAIEAFVTSLEARIDAAAVERPNPGWRPFQRLNREEYARGVRDLLGIEVDVKAFLPADTVSSGFDNIADVQTFSPTLMTGYLRGAGQISRLAMTDRIASKRVFVCRPAGSKVDARRETDCAAQIVKSLTAQAYRGAATAEDVEDALAFYSRGTATGDFENGIRMALQSILMSPRFLFRLEPPPVGAAGSAYRIGDQALASRLSFFLWGTGPDAKLIDAAKAGLLRTRDGLEGQVRRMLADKRSEALSSRFASQWLRLQDLDKVIPDSALFPKYDAALATLMRRETELFFDSVVREDRNVMDLFTADFSFLNERLARHYGVANVAGPGFRRVKVPEERRGLLGQGSILVSTSVADRTSPVLRGKWVMEVLLGTPPPPPPPNVPALDDSVKAVRAGVNLSTRQRLEEHRKNPSCNSCHRFIDPLGLALENFDVAGVWRVRDNDVPVDSAGELFDGTKISGSAGLREVLIARQDMVLRNFTENLLMYALGRRVEYGDMPAVRSIAGGAAAKGNRFSAFVLGVVNSAAYQMARPVGSGPFR